MTETVKSPGKAEKIDQFGWLKLGTFLWLMSYNYMQNYWCHFVIKM